MNTDNQTIRQSDNQNGEKAMDNPVYNGIPFDLNAIRLFGSKLYESHPVVILSRELVQNSWDATRGQQNKRVELTIDFIQSDNEEYDIEIVCQDNGKGMTESDIHNYFLKPGRTGKGLETESTGGFGIAKLAIFCNPIWYVHSQDNQFDQSIFNGGKIEKISYLGGTKVFIKLSNKIESYRIFSVIRDTLRVLYTSKIDIRLEISRDGRVVLEDNHVGFKYLAASGYKRIDTADNNGIFNVYGSNEFRFLQSSTEGYTGSMEGFDIFRINGLTQFVDWNGRKKILIFDLSGDIRPQDNGYPFDLSREKIVLQDARQAIRNISQQFIINPLSAERKLKQQEKKDIRIIEGYTEKGIAGKKPMNPNSGNNEGNQGNITSLDLGEMIKALNDVSITAMNRQRKSDNLKNPRMLLEGYKGRKVSVYEKNLLVLWTILIKLASPNGEEFSIGLTTEDSIGAYRMKDVNGIFYVINADCMKSEIKDHRLNPESLIDVTWGLACHETSHAFIDGHNEEFSSMESDRQFISAMGKFENRTTLEKIAKKAILAVSKMGE